MHKSPAASITAPIHTRYRRKWYSHCQTSSTQTPAHIDPPRWSPESSPARAARRSSVPARGVVSPASDSPPAATPPALPTTGHRSVPASATVPPLLDHRANPAQEQPPGRGPAAGPSPSLPPHMLPGPPLPTSVPTGETPCPSPLPPALLAPGQTER